MQFRLIRNELLWFDRIFDDVADFRIYFGYRKDFVYSGHVVEIENFC